MNFNMQIKGTKSWEDSQILELEHDLKQDGLRITKMERDKDGYLCIRHTTIDLDTDDFLRIINQGGKK